MQFDIDRVLLGGAYTAHFLCLTTWIGVMFFNLIIQFPMLRQRANNNTELAQWMGQQATRAAPWLYLLIAGTLASGWLIFFLKGGNVYNWSQNSALAMMASKHGLIFAMLCSHLFASLKIWPKIIFAIDNEIIKLVNQYTVTIVISTVLGVLTVFLSFLGQLQ